MIAATPTACSAEPRDDGRFSQRRGACQPSEAVSLTPRRPHAMRMRGPQLALQPYAGALDGVQTQ